MRLYNYMDVRTTFFDESNYTIQEPYSSYEYQLNDNPNHNLPVVIGDFEYNEKFYFELEIDFPENDANNNDKENNRNNINTVIKEKNEYSSKKFYFLFIIPLILW